MRRRRSLFITTAVLMVLVLFPLHEYTFEFDEVNLRLRECSRYRSWVMGIVVWERCSPPADHPTATRLRELGVLPPVKEGEAKWVLNKGFTPGVRGWVGPGKWSVRALGVTSFGTPVTLPAKEDVAANPWVRWAAADPAGAAHFWREAREFIPSGKFALYLLSARQYLDEHPGGVGAEVEAAGRRAVEQ